MKSFVIRLKKGDEAISSLSAFCQQNQIKYGWFSGLGAAMSAKLAIYDLDKKEYIRKEISGILEILNYLGNVSQLDGKAIIHSHVTLSDETFSAFGGHVDELVIAATCEIVLHQLDIELNRKFDEGIGLNLLEL
ncbi:MAG: DNA-binding protein [Candidatus Berkelbacteria bacterium]|nr:DNA-binding protein [Candidatus Berkelbacteria bacterium]